MVDDTRRPDVPLFREDDREHRRELATRVNASLAHDGSVPVTGDIDFGTFDITNTGNIEMAVNSEFRMLNSYGTIYDFVIAEDATRGYHEITCYEELTIHCGSIVNVDTFTGATSDPPVAADNHFSTYGFGGHEYEVSLGYIGFLVSGAFLLNSNVRGAPFKFFALNDAGGSRNLLELDPDTESVILPLAGDKTNPALAFGDGDTGFFEDTDDELALSIADVEAKRYIGDGTDVIFSNEANVGLTADVGSAQGNGVITSSFNVYSTVANAGDAATLPATFVVGTRIYIKNDGANSMDVFPASGDDAGAGTNTAVAVAAGAGTMFLATAANATWTQMYVG